MHLLSGAKLGTLHGSVHNSACVTEGSLHICHISEVQGPTRPVPHIDTAYKSLLHCSYDHSCVRCIQSLQFYE